MMPMDFLARANKYIRDQRARGMDVKLPESHATLTLDEVLSVRLYTGPAYQPINNFLRQIAGLSGAHRRKLAQHPGLTFSSTVSHLHRAIRKLAAVSALCEEPEPMPVWRAMRGELPRSFWTPDEQDMVCATDMAFMSASLQKNVAESYMQEGGHNVIWELQISRESDTGYHCGADVSMLSQFAHEQEVIFPPCTLLKVRKRETPMGKHAKPPPLTRQTSGLAPRDAVAKYEVGEDAIDKKFHALQVKVLPEFL